MTERPVAQLVCQDCHHFLSLGLLDESVIYNNVLLPWQAKEISVAMSAALASINHVQLLKWEVQLCCEVFDARFKWPRIEGRKLVEKGQDGNWVDGDHEHLKCSAEQPEIVEELVASLLDNLQEPRKNWWSEDESQHLGLEDVCNEELGSLLVEAELLLENECAVDGRRKRQYLLNDNEAKDECDRMRDLAREASWGISDEQRARQVPELRKNIVVDECGVLNLSIEAEPEAKLGLCTSICLIYTVSMMCYIDRAANYVYLRFIKDLLGNLIGENLWRTSLLEDLVLAKREESLEEVLGDGESEDELLPWKQGSVQDASEALWESAMNIGRLCDAQWPTYL